jgi:hypothetical protein
VAAPPRVSVDLTAPAIVLGSRRVALCPLGDQYVVEGSLRVRLVTVAERREAVRLALASSDPATTLLDELRRAALVGGAHPDADAIILALAGGAEESLSFAACARRLADGGAARDGSIDDLAALVADRLAARAARPALTDDWVRIKFAPAAAATADVTNGAGDTEGTSGFEGAASEVNALCEAMLARLLARGTPGPASWIDGRSLGADAMQTTPRPERTSWFDDLSRVARHAVTDASAPHGATPAAMTGAATSASYAAASTALAASGTVQAIAPREPPIATATSASASIDDGSDAGARPRHGALPRPADARRERPRTRVWLGRGAFGAGPAVASDANATLARGSALAERATTSRAATSLPGSLPDPGMSDFHVAGLRRGPLPRGLREASPVVSRRSPFRSVASAPPEPFLPALDDSTATAPAATGDARDPLYEMARALADECDLRGLDP